MSRVVTLRYPAVCADCGAPLSPGSRAAYYGRGQVFGRGCHEPPQVPQYPSASQDGSAALDSGHLDVPGFVAGGQRRNGSHVLVIDVFRFRVHSLVDLVATADGEERRAFLRLIRRGSAATGVDRAVTDGAPAGLGYAIDTSTFLKIYLEAAPAVLVLWSVCFDQITNAHVDGFESVELALMALGLLIETEPFHGLEDASLDWSP